MAVAPKFAYAILKAPAPVVHTLELYLDYTCPFSKKLFNQFYQNVFPVIQDKYPGKVQCIFRHQIQPWHPSSTLVHEAALAVGLVAPEKFWEYSQILFNNQSDFFDAAVLNETRNQTYKRLASLASPLASTDDIYSKLEITNSSLNNGNKVTNDLKLHIKEARLRSIHISPTVLFNGNVDNSISSGWSVDQWQEWLGKNIV
ncbi:hypothetical protein L211DRAFT_834789 [Terfezia boudieri ATCC MYA-4762]|uniref:Thioredoxin-like fold domain-containing protein n=1 Tax=Terfezia boudieri ATCC MYA-4762 TaxID=1051890 RepID=A0A3N4M149_9PEZI|nr:hypothetical protein L211DRAFT_834789 [Terfezia boudieri ATCC MYA-4762]